MRTVCRSGLLRNKEGRKGHTDGKITGGKDSGPGKKSKGAARKAGNPAALASFLAKKKEKL